MIRKTIPFSLILLTAFLSCAKQTTTPSVSATKNALLWEITGKGLKKPSYIYGTIHMIPKADFFLTDAARKAIAESQKVTFEINMEDMTNPMKLIGVASKIMMPKGTRLRDLVSADDYKLIKNRLDSLGLPLQMVEMIKPMFLSSMVEAGGKQNLLDPSAAAESSITAYETEIMAIAQKQKKKIDGLETMAFQMGLFDSIPYKVQAEMLVKAVKSKDNGDDEFKAMVETYKRQDIEAMSAMMKSGDGNNGELSNYESLLVTKRNLNWIPLMGQMMNAQPTFFAVGAGHLGGEKGVVNLLRKDGFTVRPLLK